MDEELPAHAIMSVVRDLADRSADVPLERLCIALVKILEHPAIQRDEDLMGQLVLFGAGVWRHTDAFKAGGSQTLQ